MVEGEVVCTVAKCVFLIRRFECGRWCFRGSGWVCIGLVFGLGRVDAEIAGFWFWDGSQITETACEHGAHEGLFNA
jgi:hypothetical protein